MPPNGDDAYLGQVAAAAPATALARSEKLTADGKDGVIRVDFSFVQGLSYGPRMSPNSTETRASDP
jgi:hypothetical protein